MSSLKLQTVAGVAVLVFGVVAIVVPGVASLIPLQTDIVAIIGTLAVVVGLYLAWRVWSDEQSSAGPPTVETSVELPVPGAGFDRDLRDLGSKTLYNRDHQQWILKRNDIRERLRELAVATLIDQRALSGKAAEKAIDEGTWTENPHASAFFAGNYRGSAPVGIQLRKLSPLSGTAIGQQAKHTIRELGAIVAEEPRHAAEQAESQSSDAPDGAAGAETTETGDE